MAKNSLSQPSGFLNQLYLKKKLMNQFDFWHLVIDSRNKSQFINVQLGKVKYALCQSDRKAPESTIFQVKFYMQIQIQQR